MDTKEFELALNDLETRVDRLRALYENWFRGYEKTEPQVARKDVERRVYGLRKELPRNTALRFRYHQLYQRYTTLANYWQRTAKQIEEGTYRLQLQRMRRRTGGAVVRRDPDAGLEEQETNRPPPKSYALDLDDSLDLEDLLEEFDEVVPTQPRQVLLAAEAGKKGAPHAAPIAPAQSGAMPRPAPAAPVQSGAVPRPAMSPPAGAKRPSLPPLPPNVRLGRKSGPPTGIRPAPPPPATPHASTVARAPSATQPGAPRPAVEARGSANDDQRLKHLYDEYTAARRRNNEGEVRYDSLVSSIQKMLPGLQSKHQGKQIDFEVVVKDGRVGLKPRVRA